jgi:hypothetical protein
MALCQRLSIGIAHNEIYILNVLAEHVVYGVATTTAKAQNFNDA